MAELDEVFQADIAIIYKHSPLCGASRWAQDEVMEFAAAHPDIPVFQIDVVNSRPLSREVAARLNIRHQSPQAIVLRAGRPAWSDSHSGIRKPALERAVDETRGD
ncbi:MAG TPA: bacillithiol system redox-active protein YtxJ [Gemmatimonadota bacterium]|nr:bacillithiol system redox-active protein YtxJ [Gemmatimonadota bacterium]